MPGKSDTVPWRPIPYYIIPANPPAISTPTGAKRIFNTNSASCPKNEDLTLVLDLYDMWKNGARQRVFDIKIKTDQNSFALKDIDPYVLSTDLSIKKQTPIRIEVNLPRMSGDTVEFTANQMMPKDCSSLPSINGIGIVKKN